MKPTFIFTATGLYLACILALGTVTLSSQTVEEVIAKTQQAMGGSKITSMNSVEMIGENIAGDGSFKSKYKMIVLRPNLMYIESEIQPGIFFKQAFDGKEGWSIQPWTGSTDPQMANADQRKQMGESAEEVFGGDLFSYKAKGTTMELLGQEEVEGNSAWKIRATRKDGATTTYFIDSDQYLIVKLVSKRKVQDKETEAVQYLNNYKNIGGIVQASSIETKSEGKTVFTITIEEFKTDVKVDESIFVAPKPEKKPEADKKAKNTTQPKAGKTPSSDTNSVTSPKAKTPKPSKTKKKG